ncbi:hypothetical protein BDV93DRAFT_526895 [Ceratobasidium sp. AG-I]|nr:hypothetical protein BDV93DRAFT_526895 [Ceratobasidium sp. AG-I]
MLLARSGDSVPIDISIDMSNHFMYGLSSYNHHAKRARDALEFIVAHGGVTSRWETLVVWTDEEHDAILAILDFVHNACLDNLRTLELLNETWKLHEGDALLAEVLARQASSESVMFKTQPPLLRHIQLYGIPPNLLLQRGPIPLACNLTLLDLTVADSLPHLVGLRELFIHSPRLEILRLYTSRIERTDFQHQSPAASRVYMPCLRQFTHHQWVSVSWGLSILKMVDAPNVEVFSFNLGLAEDPDAVLAYLSLGRRGERLIDDHSTLSERVGGASIYPALNHLIINGMSGSPEAFSDMLKAFPNITRLDWGMALNSDEHFFKVLNDSTTCPQLEHLRFYLVPNDLITVVHQRAKQGRPLKVVEADSFFWDEIPKSTRRELKRTLERFEPHGDLKYCSDANEDDNINESTDGNNDQGNCPASLSDP